MKRCIVIVFMLLYTCGAASAQTDPQADSVIIERFLKDTAGFRPSAPEYYRSVYARHPFYKSTMYSGKKISERKHERRKRRVEKAPVRNVGDAALWLSYHLEWHTALLNAEYKSVEGGFLITGEYYYFTDVITPYYQDRLVDTYFIGYDHSIVKVRTDKLAPPNRYFVTITINTDSITYTLPDTVGEGDIVVYPEYADNGMDGIRDLIKDHLEEWYNLLFAKSDARGKEPKHPFLETKFAYFRVDESGMSALTERMPESCARCMLSPSIASAINYDGNKNGGWIPASINGVSVPADISMTVHSEVYKNPEYDDWGFRKWRELSDLKNK